MFTQLPIILGLVVLVAGGARAEEPKDKAKVELRWLEPKQSKG